MPSRFTIHRTTKQRSESLPLHAHAEGQLTFAASGMVQIHTEEGVWMVPPQLAAWVPPGIRHRLDVLTDAELWIVHWDAEALKACGRGGSLGRAFALRITPLLRSLLDEAVATDAASEKAELLVRLMLYELTAMDDAPTFLPLPTSDVGRRVADLALADPCNTLTLDELASRAATSVRTVTRLFPTETGLTLKAWRQRARIVRAMERLARGDSSSEVAHATGFASTAAFSTAFRQVTAMTPTEFLGQQRRMLPDKIRPPASLDLRLPGKPTSRKVNNGCRAAHEEDDVVAETVGEQPRQARRTFSSSG